MVIAALNERFTVSRETVKRSKPGHWRSRGWGICRQVLKALKYWRPKGGRRKYFLGAARPARSTRLALQDKTCLAGAGCGFCVCVKNAGILNSSAGAWGHRVHRTALRASRCCRPDRGGSRTRAVDPVDRQASRSHSWTLVSPVRAATTACSSTRCPHAPAELHSKACSQQLARPTGCQFRKSIPEYCVADIPSPNIKRRHAGHQQVNGRVTFWNISFFVSRET